MASQLRELLADAFLARLYREIREAGPIRAISVDLTHRCNLRCVGCYFFAEDMDRREAPGADAEFEAFVTREQTRGTNFVTVIGGEPSLMLDRLRILAGCFRTAVVTNGLRRIPFAGLESVPIGVSSLGRSRDRYPAPREGQARHLCHRLAQLPRRPDARAGTTPRLPGTRTRSSRWWSNA